jgi:hypothetical protein
LNSLLLNVFLTFCAIFISACSAAENTKTFIPETADADLAIVYLYRPVVMSNAIYSPGLYVNGELKLSIKNGQSARLTLAPGEVTFEIEPDKNYPGLTRLTLDLTAGSSYFIRVDSTLKIEHAASYEPYRRSFNLTRIDDEFAIRQIAACCVDEESKTNTVPDSPSTTINTDDGFSVNKTQNPFAH